MVFPVGSPVSAQARIDRSQLTSPLLFSLKRNFADFFVFNFSTTGVQENERIRMLEMASARECDDGASRDDEATGAIGRDTRKGVERRRRGRKDILAVTAWSKREVV